MLSPWTKNTCPDVVDDGEILTSTDIYPFADRFNRWG